MCRLQSVQIAKNSSPLSSDSVICIRGNLALFSMLIGSFGGGVVVGGGGGSLYLSSPVLLVCGPGRLRTKGKHRTALDSSNFTLRRATIMIMLFVIGVLTFIVLFTRVSSARRADTHFLNPFDNPNIHVQD